MSNRTHVCVKCKKSYRREQNIESIKCPTCGDKCEYVHKKVRIPSPKRKKEWRIFWEQYRKEVRLIEEFRNNPNIKEIKLDILNQVWVKDRGL